MTIRVGVVGAMGRMGACVRAAVAEEPKLSLGGLLEASGHPAIGQKESGLTLTDDPQTLVANSDVLIDFSLPEPTLAVTRVAAESGVPSVIGTTGFSESQLAQLGSLAAHTAIVRAANFSVAVNVLNHLTEQATRLLGDGFDAEIVELHHAAKRDAPSGTALWLAETIANARGQNLEKVGVLAREGETGARENNTIGIQSLRGGDAAGEHTVHLIGEGERLELTHRAYTRDHFARGAVRAALWVRGRPPGLYAMADVLGLS